MPPRKEKTGKEKTALVSERGPMPTPPPTDEAPTDEAAQHEAHQEEFNCPSCTAPDSSENMVQCDKCQRWYHYSCVGVDSLIGEEEFICKLCCAGKNISYPWFSEELSAPVAKSANTTTKNSTVTANAAETTFANLNASVVPTNILNTGAIAKTTYSLTAVIPSALASASVLPSETVTRKKKPRTSSNISITSSKAHPTKYLQIELQRLDEERALKEKRLNEERERRQKEDSDYLSKKYQLLCQIAEDSSDSEGEEGFSVSKVKVNNWLVKNQTQSCPQSTIRIKEVNRAHPSLKNTSSPNQPTNTKWIEPSDRRYQQRISTTNVPQSTPNVMPCQQQTSGANMLQKTLPSELLHLQCTTPPHQAENATLSASHIAARQVLSRDLQSFAGNPEEWPLFISNYNRSTNLCGFSDEENMIRLQKTLKGKALDAVRSLLTQPNCVSRVISTLNAMYGKPIMIIQAVQRKIQMTPAPKADKFETIVNFALEVQNFCATIEASGLLAYINNPTLLQELENKLPHELRLNWAIYKQTLPECTLSHFSTWMFKIADAVNGLTAPLPSTSAAPSKGNTRNAKDRGYLNSHFEDTTDNNKTSLSKAICCICSGSCFSVANCLQFQKLSRTAKWLAVRKNNLCRKCLLTHDCNRCYSNSVCGINNCKFKHHRLLHNHDTHLERIHTQHHSNSHGHSFNSALFRVVPVTLYGNNTQLQTFAFLDNGSSITLLDREVAKQLNVKGKAQPLCLKWTGNTRRYENASEVFTLQISSSAPNAEKYTLANVHTVENLHLPPQTINPLALEKRFHHLRGLEVQGYENATPRLLIGLNNTFLGLPLKFKEGSLQEPVATKTRLGWIVHGNCSDVFPLEKNVAEQHNFHICECNNDELERLVEEFIDTENFGVSTTTTLSNDDKRALDMLESHTIRKNGHFETALLWKFDNFELPNSFTMARKRLTCLHKRMLREPNLSEQISIKIEDYVHKGYARKLSTKEISEGHNKSWYLPIFPVINPNKPGKLRIVWDAAAKVQGVSLNSFLLKGPDQLTSLISVIYKFRENLVAICGDIQEMFHQVHIRAEDQNFQRFLWSRNAEEPPDVYVMTVMTFGATCSPCCAQYIKNKNADEFSQKYPRAARSIRENHYVDDLMDSVETEEQAVQLAREIKHIHQEGGFHIRNWISNSALVLKALSSDPIDQINLNRNVELSTEKVLGMWWSTFNDCLVFKLSSNLKQAEVLSGTRRPTKREVLRILMTIFDPLGLLAHFLMYVKIILQDIWRSKIAWDQQIRDAEYEKWMKWIRYLPQVETLKIPRCYISPHIISNKSERQLHVFVDASENGFAAVAYIRTSNDSTVECALIGAKTRVAPLKNLSIPRLELQAAVLGARLAKSISNSHSLKFSQQFFWSDSKNVLSWLRSDHRRYKQFVAFRVSEILELSKVSEWHWISTKLNVADEGTKWQKSPNFSSQSRWYNGPEFLKLLQDNWPQEPHSYQQTVEEMKTQFINIHMQPPKKVFRFDENSRWRLLVRSSAYVIRFINNIKLKKQSKEKIVGPLKQDELQLAEMALIKEAQSSEYEDEIADLSANKPGVEKSSQIFNLCPYLDDNNILRANGRINLSADASEYMKRPIILPKAHRITQLIITDFHHRYNHQNHETVINELRQKFHIPRMRAALRSVRLLCQECKNNSTRPQVPIMAQLPPARLASFSRPFSFVGVDYFGPMYVTVHRRTEKRWGVLLTCLTTRAVHIEIAYTLSSDSCIMALRNFVTRRGVPQEFFSDNGTNFVGAERELREALQNVNQERLMETVVAVWRQQKLFVNSNTYFSNCNELQIPLLKKIRFNK